MILKLTGMKSARIPALGKVVIREQKFEVDNEIGKSLLNNGLFVEIKENKIKEDK